MRSTLLVSLSLLFVSMVVGTAIQPKTSFKQATRSGIVTRAARRKRLAAMKGQLEPRQANPSCRSYPTCGASARSGTNFCTLRGYDLRNIADIGGSLTYSNEDCIRQCEAFSGCVASLWNPGRVNTESIESTGQNCLFKGDDFTSQSLSVTSGAAYILTLMGSCCDFESKFPTQGLPDACQDDGQGFMFPTCSGSRRTNSGSATYAGMDIRSTADTPSPGYPLDAPLSGGRPAAMRAENLATCLASCDSFPSQCVAARWWPARGTPDNINSCFFSDSRYASSPIGGEGYRNDSNIDLHIRDTSCEAQVGQVPNIVNRYCCNDPVRSYPTCPNSAGDGSAFYSGYDNNQNDISAYGPNNVPSLAATSLADCNSRCFNEIGAACIGTTFTGATTGTNCYFKTAVSAASLVDRDYVGGGASLIGGCSQYSADIGAADSVCCNNN